MAADQADARSPRQRTNGITEGQLSNVIVTTAHGSFCAVCQSLLSIEEEDFGVCDACDGEGIGGDDDFEEDQECPTCRGKGTVNPLTPNLPEGFLCLGTDTCPRCEGSGRWD